MTDPRLPDPMIDIGDDGTPRSGVSGDVYFSVDGGIDETRHVFLGGIGAPEVWRDARRFRIGELGFGTGLNFLVAWKDWQASAPAGATLDYIAVEGYPPDAETLTRAFAPMTEVGEEAAALIAQWPPRLGGFHRMIFAQGRVRLTLAFGPVRDMLAAMSQPVDAWFLDGFAPAKNPDMWAPDVLCHVARLTRPGGRAATFTVAGLVRRGLADRGFLVEKRPGFGHKRECLTATKGGTTLDQNVPKSVAIIGAGIAGGCMARALATRGLDVTLIDAAPAPGSAASGNPAALIAPRLPRERTVLGRVMAASYLFAVPYYDVLAAEGAEVWLGARGGFAMARNHDEDERQRRAAAAFALPETVMRRVDAAEASRLTGAPVPLPGLWFDGAGTLSPPAVTSALARAATYVRGSAEEITPRAGGGWSLVVDDVGHTADAVVVCAGVEVTDLLTTDWPIRANRGQLAYLPNIKNGPKVPITYGGYLSPSVPLGDGNTGHVLGATYARHGEVPGDDWHRVRDEDHTDMLKNLAANLPGIDAATPVGGRTALRATVRDYLPVAGAVSPGLYVLAGLGSRGFLTAPLLAEALADLIAEAPPALPADLMAAVSPSRFR